MKKIYNLLFIVAIILFAVISYIMYTFNAKSLSFVSISINPDVTLVVGDKNVVEEVISINKDADIITSDLNLVGKDVEDASTQIIDAAIETGFIDEYSDENMIIVTTTNEDNRIRESLETRVVARMNKHLEMRNIYPILVINGVDDEIKSDATAYGISNGKMLLINKAVATNSELSKDELVNMSIKEIQQEIRDYVKKRHEASKETKDELKAKWRQTKETLKENYQNRVESLKTNLLNDADIDSSNMTQEEKNAAVSNMLKIKKDEVIDNVNKIKDELKKKVNNDVAPFIKERVNTIRNRIRTNTGKEE